MNTLMINGHWLTGEGEWLVSRNPLDNRVLWKKRAADARQAALAVDAARAAQPGWAQRPLMERVACLRRFAGLLRQHQKSLAHVIELETGKASAECLAEVDAMVNKIRISLEAFRARTGEWRHGEWGLAENECLDHVAFGRRGGSFEHAEERSGTLFEAIEEMNLSIPG